MQNLELDPTLNRHYLDQMIELDKVNYGNYPGENFLDIAQRFPWAYTVLRRGHNVLGYGLALPLKKNAFDALKVAHMDEEELNSKHIGELSPAGFYFASLAVSPDANYRERAMIVGATVGPLLRLSTETIALAVSSQGEKVLKMIHMNPLWSSLNLRGLGGYRPMLYSKQGFVHI